MAEDLYYSQPVADLAAWGVLAGTECAEGFCPDEEIDRKTMAVWVVRILDGEDPSPVLRSRFGDVDSDSFYGSFIERMAELGVTSGCGDGADFCPHRSVSRAQMAAFLSRAYKASSMSPPQNGSPRLGAWSRFGRLRRTGTMFRAGQPPCRRAPPRRQR